MITKLKPSTGKARVHRRLLPFLHRIYLYLLPPFTLLFSFTCFHQNTQYKLSAAILITPMKPSIKHHHIYRRLPHSQYRYHNGICMGAEIKYIQRFQLSFYAARFLVLVYSYPDPSSKPHTRQINSISHKSEFSLLPRHLQPPSVQLITSYELRQILRRFERDVQEVVSLTATCFQGLLALY